jgi:hypothetical protein
LEKVIDQAAGGLCVAEVISRIAVWELNPGDIPG